MADVNLGAGSSTGLHPVKTAVTAQTIAPNNVKRFIKTKIWLIIDIKIVKMIKTLKLIAETKLYLQHDTVNTKNGGFLILVMIDRKNLSEDLNFRLNVARSCCDAFFPGSNAQGHTMIVRNLKEGRRWLYSPDSNCLTGFTEVRLTQSEKLMLLYVCSGMTTNMMSEVMNKSADTINGYRKSVIAKLGVQNISEAILMAMIHKLL